MVSIVLPPRVGGTDPVVLVPGSGGGVASEATFPRAVGPAGPGVAAGGTTGQVLAKSSNADYATQWVDQSGGGGSSPPFPISDITGLQTSLDGKQPLDADLSALAALTGTNTLYYRSADSVWSPVIIGTNLTFTGGTLSATGGGVTPPFAISDTTGLQTALDGKQPLDGDLTAIAALTTTTFGRGQLTYADASAAKTALTLVKGDVGLANVDNTSDANKPVSTATQTALNLKANLASPTFTGTVSGISKAMVGLGNVDNTSDANKPVSTAQQTALNLKANLASPTFTGTVVLPAGQVVNGVTLITGGSATTYLDGTGAYSTPAGGGGGSVAWGAITGTLSAQTDLQAALNAKANVSGQVFTGAISATNLSGTNTGDQTITLTGEATGSGTGSFAVTVSNAAVIAKVLTGYASGAGTISATDSILSAIQKLNGNIALKANLASPTFTGTVTLPAGQVVNGVTLTTGGSATTYLNGAGAYTTPAGGGGGGAANMTLFRQIRALDATARYLLPMNILPTTGTVALVAGRIYYMPFEVEIKTDGVAMEVTTLGAGNFRAAIYSCRTADGLPDQLLAAGAEISVSTTGLKVSNFTALTIAQPTWVAVTTSVNVTVRAGLINPYGIARSMGAVNLTANGSAYGVQRSSGTYAAFATTAAYDLDYNGLLSIAMRGSL